MDTKRTSPSKFAGWSWLARSSKKTRTWGRATSVCLVSCSRRTRWVMISKRLLLPSRNWARCSTSNRFSSKLHSRSSSLWSETELRMRIRAWQRLSSSPLPPWLRKEKQHRKSSFKDWSPTKVLTSSWMSKKTCSETCVDSANKLG